MTLVTTLVIETPLPICAIRWDHANISTLSANETVFFLWLFVFIMNRTKKFRVVAVANQWKLKNFVVVDAMENICLSHAMLDVRNEKQKWIKYFNWIFRPIIFNIPEKIQMFILNL